ncbi:MAG TPA: pyridoxal-phosphate dependent enzyme, partial [Pseudonocardiaceae bacterium]|nr:pyridoxal-phosphate dependent enzyme [Pseudonocardiaceae bacterium]
RPDQYANPDNPASHYHTTGPELWAQTEGQLTHFVAGVGTGGTISGTGRYLKEVSGGRVRIIGADPDGSVFSGGTGRPYLVEGVGQPSLPGSFDPSVPDRIIAVSDRDSVATTLALAREEGILTGGSGGMAVAVARTVARECSSGDVVVVLLPDSGRGYLSKIFDDDWLRRFGFADRTDDGPLVGDVLTGAGLPVAAPVRTVAEALAILHANGARYLPVSAAPPPVRLAEIVGTVTEPALAALVAGGRGADPVGSHLGPVLPMVGRGQSVAEIADTLAAGAAIVLDGGLPVALLTIPDLMAATAGSAGIPTRDGETR